MPIPVPQPEVEKYSGFYHDRDVAYKLLGILQSYAPNGLVQAKLAQDYNLVEKNEGIEYVPRYLAEILNDGLNNGNWPWVVPTTK